MSYNKCIASILIFLSPWLHIYSQKIQFTWEGATTSNKAIWKDRDSFNVYTVGGVDVTVALSDPWKINTSSSQMSEFNDFTKTNTFFGRGSLAFQVLSTQKNQAACLNFNFSKPIYLNQFQVWDIDMLQTGTNPLATYQDSIFMMAFDGSDPTALQIKKLSDSTTFTIQGQSVKAKYVANTNGNVSHTNIIGAIDASATSPMTSFRLCYANGSEDEGLSNSHAIRVPGFQFTEVLGSIEGLVLEEGSQIPLPGALLTLLDKDGQLVVNKLGQIMQATTAQDGRYFFDQLPLATYKVVQVNPAGYNSVRDIDEINDNEILVSINTQNQHSVNNNFIEVLGAPLPIELTELYVENIQDQKYRLIWNTSVELNRHYFEVFLADASFDFKAIGKVFTKNHRTNSYQFEFENAIIGTSYVRLVQYDLDGSAHECGIVTIQQKPNLEFDIKPNPTSEFLSVYWQQPIPDVKYQIFDQQGKLTLTGKLQTNEGIMTTIDLRDIKPGQYYLNVLGRTFLKTKPFVKI